MYKKILVPLDGSEQSEKILPLVRILAEISQLEVVLLHVVEYPYELYQPCYKYPPCNPNLMNIIQNRKSDIYDHDRQYLEQMISTIVLAGLKATIEVRDGPVVEAILASAEQFDVDLIAMSTCGQGNCSRWGIGAVADQVLRKSPRPVMLLRPTHCSFIIDNSSVFSTSVPKEIEI